MPATARDTLRAAAAAYTPRPIARRALFAGLVALVWILTPLAMIFAPRWTLAHLRRGFRRGAKSPLPRKTKLFHL